MVRKVVGGWLVWVVVVGWCWLGVFLVLICHPAFAAWVLVGGVSRPHEPKWKMGMSRVKVGG
jgi:hypothetical protein